MSWFPIGADVDELHPSSVLSSSGNQNSVRSNRLPIILIDPTRPVGGAVCARRRGYASCEVIWQWIAWSTWPASGSAWPRFRHLGRKPCNPRRIARPCREQGVQARSSRSLRQRERGPSLVLLLHQEERRPRPSRTRRDPARPAANRPAHDLPRSAPRRLPRAPRQGRRWPSLLRASSPGHSPTARRT